MKRSKRNSKMRSKRTNKMYMDDALLKGWIIRNWEIHTADIDYYYSDGGNEVILTDAYNTCRMVHRALLKKPELMSQWIKKLAKASDLENVETWLEHAYYEAIDHMSEVKEEPSPERYAVTLLKSLWNSDFKFSEFLKYEILEIYAYPRALSLVDDDSYSLDRSSSFWENTLVRHLWLVKLCHMRFGSHITECVSPIGEAYEQFIKAGESSDPFWLVVKDVLAKRHIAYHSGLMEALDELNGSELAFEDSDVSI